MALTIKHEVWARVPEEVPVSVGEDFAKTDVDAA